MKRVRPEEWQCPGKTPGKELEDCMFFDCLYSPKQEEETDEFIAAKLREFERELDNLSDEVKEAYYVALRQDIKQKTHYVTSKKFYLAFLRADWYDASRAALRFAKHFQHKLELFGVEMLSRSVRQDDLNEDDMKVLASGYQHFGGLDNGGRIVFFSGRNRLRELGLLNEHYVKNILRVTFYQMMFIIEDNESALVNGAVGIRWSLNSTLPLKDYRLLFQSTARLYSQAMPFKLVATHSCCNNTTEHLCTTWMESLTKRFLRHTSHNHGPSTAACFAGLSKFGIDVNALPINFNGDFRPDLHKKQIEEWRWKDAVEASKMPMKFESVDKVYSSAVNFEITNKVYSSEVKFESANTVYSSEVRKTELTSTNKEKTKTGRDHKPTEKQRIKPGKCREMPPHEQLPNKLMQILENQKFPDSIWWSGGGNSIAINKKLICESVLPAEFYGIRLNSFLRNLRRWGFQRISTKGDGNPNVLEYQHRLFKRNAPHLLKQWNVENENTKQKEKLPVRLMKILDSNMAVDAIWWVRDDKAFAINTNRFICDVLERYFEGVKMSSFLRMLRRWGFKRVFEEEKNSAAISLVFEHSMFQKNVPISPEKLESWIQLNGLEQASTSKGEQFLKKLHAIIANQELKHAVWWVNDGSAFAMNTENFIRDVLPREFNAINICSFRRILKSWGFQKLESDSGVSIFEHPLFKKNSAELQSDNILMQ